MVPAYDLLAPHYDAVTGDAASEARLVRDIIQRRHSQAVTLLDVACGTGAVTALLAGKYRVSGLDISSRMLAVARAKLPGQTPLFLADMARFELNTRFDAIICAYQGVNHLLGFPAWESFFGCVYDHLDEDGVFVFDIATVGYLRMMVGAPRIVQQFGDNYLVIRVSMTDELVFRWHIEVFELQPDGRYRLLTQTLTMRSFPLDQIRVALCQVFVDIEVLGVHGGPADEDSADRVWFACRKPAQPGPPADRAVVPAPVAGRR